MFGIAFVSNFVSISRKSNILLANFTLFLGFKMCKMKISFSRSFYVGFLELRCLFKAFRLKAESIISLKVRKSKESG